ncbi:hypothetical protein D3C78_770250 [compost metagenome]
MIPLIRRVKIKKAEINITTPTMRKYQVPPMVASFKPKPPIARPMIVISPTRSHCRNFAIPRGALPNAISVSLKTSYFPRNATLRMYHMGN